ncbi:MAG: hypothetical protein ACXAE3_08515, partial [Candidatus Kariarchaeaceae archaeon]
MSMNTVQALPNGNGVQKYNPGLGVADFALIKGYATHAIFDFGSFDLPTGTWLSIIYGVTSGLIPVGSDVDAEVAGLIDFVMTSTWHNVWDG